MLTDTTATVLTSDDAEEEGVTVSSPGPILQAERERQGLSKKEVADRLHITVHYVKAIESDSHDKLPGAVFAKGYIKSYALLLQMNESDVMQAYTDFNAQKMAAKEVVNRNLAQRRKDRNRPWLVLSIVAFVAGFGGLWAYNSFFGNTPVQVANELTDNVTETSDLQAQTAVSPSSIEAQSTSASSPVVSDQEEGEQEQAVSLLTDVQAAVEPEQAAIASASVATTQEPASNNADVSVDDRVIQVGTVGSDLLRISFTGDSWIEVNDDSNQVYRDIRSSGDILEITGDAPFNILLGDASFARLSLNGKAIEFSENIRIDNSARLTVGLQ